MFLSKKWIVLCNGLRSCEGEKCSNESKSSIIDDIDGYNDRNPFDAFARFWKIKTDVLLFCSYS